MVKVCRWTAGVAVLALAAGMNGLARGQAPALTEYQVKAGFIFNFARLIEWPRRTQGSTLPVCLVGEGPLRESGAVIAGKDVNGRRIELRGVAPAEVASCDIVLVAASNEALVAAVIAAAQQHSVLTIGDAEGLAARGLVIDFFQDGQELRFSVNVDAARRAGLKPSARLLNMARVVHDGARP